MNIIKKIIGLFSKQTELERRIDTLKLVASNNNFKLKGHYKESNKLVFEKEDTLIVINLITNDVVTTIGKKKMKRTNLAEIEIIQVIENPKVKLSKPVQWI